MPAQSSTLKGEVVALKRKRIVDAARRLFYEKGYERTTLDDIAERLEVTKQFIYSYYKNKTEILQHSSATWITHLLPEFREAEPGMGETETVVGHTKQQSSLVLSKLSDVRAAEQDRKQEIARGIGGDDLFPGKKGRSPIQRCPKKNVAERKRRHVQSCLHRLRRREGA